MSLHVLKWIVLILAIWTCVGLAVGMLLGMWIKRMKKIDRHHWHNGNHPQPCGK